MEYAGEVRIEIDASFRKIVIKYKQLLTITDRMFTTGDPSWRVENDKANEVCENILNLLGFDISKYFVAFPYSDKFICIRPND